MDAEQAGLMQMQLCHNAEDLQTYLKDLQDWEDEIKEKDRNLSKQKPILKEVKDVRYSAKVNDVRRSGLILKSCEHFQQPAI